MDRDGRNENARNHVLIQIVSTTMHVTSVHILLKLSFVLLNNKGLALFI